MVKFEFDIDRESPFQPGKPVTPDNFKGRHSSIRKILRYVNKAKKGDTQHFFLTGERGMGKTSLAEFVKNYVETEYNMIGIYISNKGNNSLDSLIVNIFEGLINKIPRNSLKDKIKNLFGEIESIEFKGTKVIFKPDEEIVEDLIKNFAYKLRDIFNDLPKNEGIFLIIDDINGLSESNEFVDWYKSFVDSIEVNQFNLPLYVLFAGYPEKFDNLVRLEPSFGRIFNHEKIQSLNDHDVKEFFIDSFDSVNMKLEEEALDTITSFVMGLPLMMQQIGDSVFWAADNNLINKDIAYYGVIDASKEIGNKQIRPILNQIKSEYYEDILLKLGRYEQFSFKKSEINQYLNEKEKNVFTDFLSRMQDLGILNSIGPKNSGKYAFSNLLYYIYFVIVSIDKFKD